jgi:ATP-dependent 26S proteasome regulatory subunit
VALDPSLAQLRSCVTEAAVLPLGSPYVKQHAPVVSAMLLYGARGTGKTMLARGIAAETNATWLDLSPRNIGTFAL